MKTQVFKWTGNVPGYGANTPSGEFAVLIPGNHIATSRGEMALPGENVGFIDVHVRNGELLITGAGQSSDKALLRQGSAWHTIAPVAYGMAPCIFNPELNEVWVATNGTQALRVNLATGETKTVLAYTGSQGFGYAQANGEVMDAWKVYIDLPRGLCVYTDFGDVAIGQGVNDGAVVRFADDGIVRHLASGMLRNLRSKRLGDKFAITMVDYAKHETTLIWASEAELRALAPLGTAPTPDKEPTPVPTVKWPLAPNKKDVVARVMAEHPEIDLVNETTRAAILPHIIKALGGKPWGRKATNKERTKFNTDAIAFLRPDGDFEIIDVIASGGPAWLTAKSKTPTKQGANGWWAEQPVSAGDPPSPGPVEPGKPAPAPGKLLLVDTHVLESIIVAMGQAINAHENRIKALEAKPAPIATAAPSRVAIRAENGSYLHAVDGGGGVADFDRTAVGGHETFTLEPR